MTSAKRAEVLYYTFTERGGSMSSSGPGSILPLPDLPLPQQHRIVIIYDEATGNIGAHGLPVNKIIAFGMLEMARAIVMSQTQIAPVKPSPIIRPGNM